MEITKMPIKGRMNKLWCIWWDTPYSNKKDIPQLHGNVDESHTCDTEPKKPDARADVMIPLMFSTRPGETHLR